MSESANLDQLGKKIDYNFKDDHLLHRALTHSSYANENGLTKQDCNERLEFLGDAVLELVTSQYLFTKYPEKLEGQLTKQRAKMVCEPTLAKFAEYLALGKLIYLGKGEDNSGGRQRSSLLSDVVEAVIGAIFVDGGFDQAKQFIETIFLPFAEECELFVDSKTSLQERLQRSSQADIIYDIVDEAGPDHDKYFVVRVLHDDYELGRGEGHSKKEAEQQAAADALLNLAKSDQ